MSKKTRLLGPDGTPYKAPRKPDTDAERGPISLNHSFRLYFNGQEVGAIVKDVSFDQKRPQPLADAVEAQVAALTATFDGIGGEELPKPPADLTSYDDAFASAAKNCDHPDGEDVTYAKREMYCPTCRRYYKRPRGIWGY